MNEENPIGLSEFIEQVKKDLLETQDQDSVPLLAIEKVEVEVKVVANRVKGGKAGLKLSVFGIGADAGIDTKSKQENAQTVKITLSPLLTKDQLLMRMTPQKQELVFQQGDKAIARSTNSDESHDPSDIA